MIYKNPSELIEAIKAFSINTSLYDIATLEDKEYQDLFDNQEFVIIDTETTGLVGEIIEIGAVTVKGNKIRMKDGKFLTFNSAKKQIHNVDFFGTLIFPKPIIKANGERKYYIDPFITEITHIDIPLLESCLDGVAPNKSTYDFVGAFEEFMDYIGPNPIVAHNFQFDISRIKDSLANMYINELFNRVDHKKIKRFLNLTTIDTLKDAKKILKVNDVDNHKNSVLSSKYGVVADDTMLHRAYYDTFFTGSVFFGLLKDARMSILEIDSLVENIDKYN